MPPGRVVEAVDVLVDRRPADVVVGVVLMVDPLGLQRREEALGDGVVIAVAGATHARDDSPLGERGPVVVAGVGAAAIGVVYESGTRTTALQRVIERRESE